MTWINGNWWPLYTPEWWSPIVSKNPFDPYFFVHMQAGIILFNVVGYPLWRLFNKNADLGSCNILGNTFKRCVPYKGGLISEDIFNLVPS